MNHINWRSTLWLILSTVLIPALLSITVGILILVFYRESWDVAFGVLVLCFAFFAVVGSFITVFLLRRTSRLAQLQAEFIANISHDFRTPLTSIRMFVETLLQDRVTDPEERRRCLKTLDREARRMEQLVQRVLTFRQVERITKEGLNLSRHEPGQLILDALAPLEVDQVAASRLELVVEPQLPDVQVDHDMMVEAVRNLVSNALKYSGDGAVVITLRNDGEGIAISVRDQGTSIPKRAQKRIFRRFYRVPGTGQSGSGLGLAIARHAAVAHGGSLDLKSSRGAGNVFTLRFPLQEQVGAPGARCDEPVGASEVDPPPSPAGSDAR